jgi:hypothetical protein
MARGSGRSLGAAAHDFLEVVPQAPLSRQLSYVLAPATGATPRRVASLLGVTQGRLRKWTSGQVTPNRTNQGKIDRLYRRFWGTNHTARGGLTVSNQMIRITGPIRVNGKKRSSLIIEQGNAPRDWPALRASSPGDISRNYGALFTEALDILIPYLAFWPGRYTLATV